ncbi:MAG: flagellar biosynthesis protein FlhF [Clostridium sp.]
MIIKKYLVANMNEALTRIRHELGKDAVIISQRKVKKQGFKGFFEPKLIEVTAAVESKASEETPKFNKKNDSSFEDSLEDIKRVMERELQNKKKDTDVQVEQKEVKDNASLEKDVMEMKELLNKVIKNTQKEEEVNPVKEFINNIDIDEELIKGYEDNIKDVNELKSIIADEIEIGNNNLLGNVVLVGPTGVGKTTTIAKLAGRLSLIEKKKVGLITVDTYRIGAVDQLKTYAEIMNIPFKVVITIKEMEEAIESMKDCDVVLIDTTGRSSKNAMQISELRAFVQKTKADSIKLVVSSTTKNKDIKTIVEGYKELSYDSIIITKLDETSVYGSLYNIYKYAGTPISYITTGQNVPDDIKTPSKDEILNFILGEELLC